MADKPIIRYLMNGEYHDATVADIGDLSKLLTTVKTNIVEAINSLSEGGNWTDNRVSELIDQLDGMEQVISDVQQEVATGGLNTNQQAQINLVLQEKIAEINVEIDRSLEAIKKDIEAVEQNVSDVAQDISAIESQYNQRVIEVNEALVNAKTQIEDTITDLESVRETLRMTGDQVATIETEVDTVKGELTQKASKSDLDELEATVTSNETLIKQNAEKIELKASQQDLDLITDRVSNAEASIELTAEEIALKVSHEEMREEIEKSATSNGNLLRGTRDWHNWQTNDATNASVSLDMYQRCHVQIQKQKNKYLFTTLNELEVGRTYTVSVFAKADQAQATLKLGIFNDAHTLLHNKNTIIGQQWERYAISFVADENQSEVKVFSDDLATGNQMYLAAIKIEKGMKHTAWEPHFEDIYERVVTAETEISQNAEGIRLQADKIVKQGEDIEANSSEIAVLNDEISLTTQKIEDIDGEVKANKASIELNANEIKQKVSETQVGELIADIELDNKNRIINSDFALEKQNWTSAGSGFSIVEHDGRKWAKASRSGLSANLINSLISNRFPVKDGERLTFSFDFFTPDVSKIDVKTVFSIELFDIQDIKIATKLFTLDELEGQISSNAIGQKKGIYVIDREDAAKGRVSIHLYRNGEVHYTRVMLQKGSIQPTEWSPAPEDAQLIRAQLETSITQNAESIELKASKTEIETVKRDVEHLESELEITAENITSSVKEYTDTQIAGIEVGGRNYYKKATTISGKSGLTNIVKEHPDTPNGFYFVGISGNTGGLRINNVVTENGWWTVSFWVRGSQSVSTSFSLDICDYGQTKITTTSDNTWKYVTHSVEVKNHNYSPNVYNFVDFDNINWAYFYVKDFKVEKGNKATDWTPAPEDVDAGIEAAKSYAESKIEQTANSITSTVKEYTDNAVGQVDDKLKELGVFPAYSWSPDGTDRFTQIYPNENLLKRTKAPITITGNNKVNYVPPECRFSFVKVPLNKLWPDISVGDKINFSITADITGSGFAGTFIAQVASSPWSNILPRYTITKAESVELSGVLTIGAGVLESESQYCVEIRLDNVPSTVSITFSNAKLEKGNVKTAYTTAPTEDFENAYPTYIGYCKTKSQNPADYTWELRGEGALNSAQSYADSKIEQTANSITSTVKQYTDSGILESENRTKSYADSKIEQTSNSITSSVKEYTDNQVNVVNDKIDNIEVGGRNYFIDSAKERTGSREFVNSTAWDMAPLINQYGLERDYTVSFDLKAKLEGTVNVYSQNGSGTRYDIGQHPITATTEYKRYSATFKPKLSNQSLSQALLAFYGTYDSGRIPTIKNVKFELGNKATDWSPAPEDIDSNILASENRTKSYADSKIEQTASSITSTVKEYTDAQVLSSEDRAKSYADSKIEQTANSITSTVNNYTDSKVGVVNDKIDNISVGGRNIVFNTGRLHEGWDKTWAVNFGTRTTTSDGIKLTATSNNQTGIGDKVSIETLTNPDIIVTLEARGLGDIEPYLLMSSGANAPLHKISLTSTTEFKKYTFNQALNLNSFSSKIDTFSLLVRGTNNWFEVKNGSLKVEFGNKATDWTPAPEDLENIVNDMGIYTAYAWSADGTDRFTDTYPNENFALNSQQVFDHVASRPGVNDKSMDSPFKSSIGTGSPNSLFVALEKQAGDSYTVSCDYEFYKTDGSAFDKSDFAANFLIQFLRFSGSNSSWTGTAKLKQAELPDTGKGFIMQTAKIDARDLQPHTGLCIRMSYNYFPAGYGVRVTNYKLEFGNGSIYTPAPADDFENAYPTYIGYCKTQSANYLDYLWELRASSVQNNLDGLQVGGTNLIINSLKALENKILIANGTATKRIVESTTSPTGEAIEWILTAKTGSYLFYIGNFKNIAKEVLRAGEEYTLSFMAKAEADFALNGTAVNQTKVIRHNFKQMKTTYQKFYVVFSPTVNSTDATNMDFHFFADNNDMVGKRIHIHSFQVEKGNSPTDWSPSPADVDQKIDEIRTGTRNLLVGTGKFSKGVSGVRGEITSELLYGNAVLKNIGNSAGASDPFTLKTSIIPNAKEYTLTFFARADVANTEARCYFYSPNTTTLSRNNQGFSSTGSDGKSRFTLSTSWQQYWVKWTQTATETTKTVIVGRTESTTNPIYISSPMLAEGNIPVPWTPAPEDVQQNIIESETRTKSYTDSRIEQTASSITSTVTKIETAVSQKEIIARAASGLLLTTDPFFESGTNSIGVYNNTGNGLVTITRENVTGSQPSGLTTRLKIVSKGAASPSWGGIQRSTNSRINAEFLVRFNASLPTGRTFVPNQNSIGNNSLVQWLTSAAGTGKFQEYMYYVRCGDSGSFSTFGHLYVKDGTTPTEATPLTWYLSKYEMIDISKNQQSQIKQLSDRITLETSASNLVSSINLAPSGIKLSGKVVTIDSTSTILNGAIKAQHIQAESLSSISAKTGKLEITDNLLFSTPNKGLSGKYDNAYLIEQLMVRSTGDFSLTQNELVFDGEIRHDNVEINKKFGGKLYAVYGSHMIKFRRTANSNIAGSKNSELEITPSSISLRADQHNDIFSLKTILPEPNAEFPNDEPTYYGHSEIDVLGSVRVDSEWTGDRDVTALSVRSVETGRAINVESGSVLLAPSRYASYGGGLDCCNSDVIGINALVFGNSDGGYDPCNNNGEGLLFPRSNTWIPPRGDGGSMSGFDNFRIMDGNAYFNDQVVFNENIKEALWSGTAYMNGSQNLKMKKSINNCPNGWALWWVQYRDGADAGFGYIWSYIHKRQAGTGGGIYCPVHHGDDILKTKYVYVSDPNYLRGVDSNQQNSKNLIVLKGVFAW